MRRGALASTRACRCVRLPAAALKRKRALAQLGIVDVGGLAQASEETLRQTFGPNIGSWLQQIARGIDETPVMPEHPQARSLGRQMTYQHDLTDPVAIEMEVARPAATVAADLATAGKLAQSIVVVIRFAPFETHSHSGRPVGPSAEESQHTQAALIALERFEFDWPLRLVGVRPELVPGTASARCTSAAGLPSAVRDDNVRDRCVQLTLQALELSTLLPRLTIMGGA